MSQALSRRPSTAEGWVGYQASGYGISAAHSGTGTDITPRAYIFLSVSFYQCFLLMFHLSTINAIQVAQSSLDTRANLKRRG
jgi:hypothetical protein